MDAAIVQRVQAKRPASKTRQTSGQRHGEVSRSLERSDATVKGRFLVKSRRGGRHPPKKNGSKNEKVFKNTAFVGHKEAGRYPLPGRLPT